MRFCERCREPKGALHSAVVTVSEQEQPWTTKRLLGWINEAFTRKGLESPRLQAEMLVAHVLGCERLRLYMEADRPATPLERQTLRDLVGRALKDEPIDYLVGERWFFGLGFHVSKAVLVPRPSTEAVVEQVLLNVRARMGVGAGSAGMMGVGNDEPAVSPSSPGARRGNLGEGVRIADVCTGSGCIAIALLKNLPGATAIATDISPDALDVAGKNAARHRVGDRLELLPGDLLGPLFEHPSAPAAHDGRDGFHYLVSNPPYIPDSEWAEVPPNVRNYEPETALRGGADGMDFLRRIVDDGPRLIRAEGLLVLETAASTAQQVLELVRSHPLMSAETCRVVHDLEGLPRVVVGARRAEG